MNRAKSIVLVGAAVVILLCALVVIFGGGEPAADDASGEQAPGESLSPLPTSTSTPDEVLPDVSTNPATDPDYDDHGSDSIEVDPNAPAIVTSPEDGARQQAAIAYAIESLGKFARPAAATTASAWFGALKPYLSPRFLDNFQHIDPSQVPMTRVTGAGYVVPNPAPPELLTMVRAGTDAGDYAVELELDEDGWHVMAIYPWQDR